MKHFLTALALRALALAACSTEPATNNAAASNETLPLPVNLTDEPGNVTAPAELVVKDALTPEGLGALRIGMTRKEVVAAFGDSDAANAEPETCEEFHPARAPAGVVVMLESGRVTRISLIDDSAIKTDAGVGVGASAAQVKAVYGPRAVASPHKYVGPPAEYLTVWTSGSGGPGSLGIVYEIDDHGKVSAIHAGGPAIRYVEGCA